MKKKLLLAGAALLVLLGILIPLGYTGKLTRPEGTKTEQTAVSSVTRSETASGTLQGTAGGSANGSAASGAQESSQTAADTVQGSNTEVKSGIGTANAAKSTGNSTGSSTSGQTAPPPPPLATPTPMPDLAVKVDITIVGKSGEVIFGPSSVSIQKDNKWGDTVMGGLHATGVPYRMHDKYTTFVVSISGQVNEGMNGWMYKVNGQLGNVAAGDKKVVTGDKIVWWYSTGDRQGP